MTPRHRVEDCPPVQEEIDWSDVTAYAKEYAARCAEGTLHYAEQRDYDERMLENVMTAVYGPDFWDWWNDR